MIKFADKNYILLAIYFILSLVFYPVIYLYNNKYYFPKEDYIKYLESPATIALLSILIALFTIIIIQKVNWQKYLKLIIIVFLLISSILISLPVVSSSDIFQYIFHAKIYNQYKQNPYTLYPYQFPDDILLDKVSDRQITAIYGPVWTLISIGLNKISMNDLELNVMLIKILNFIFIILTALLIFKIAKPNEKYLALFFFILNPIIFYEFLLDGHNDIAMIFFIVLAIYLLKTKKYFWILPASTLSILIKPLTIILLPIIFLYLIKRTNLSNVISSIILSIIIFILSWLPFYQGIETLKGFKKISSQASHPLLYLTNLFNLNLYYTKIAMLIFFIIIYLVVIIYILNIKRHSFTNFLLFISILFLLIASFWLQPWYLTILIPLIAVKIPNNKLVYSLNIVYLLLIVYGFLADNLII